MELLVQENSTQWNKSKDYHRPRILIVEDDMSLKPFWLHLIETVDETAEIKWMTTQEGAFHSLKKWNQSGRPYDLVISDVFLSGQKTGVDLWRESERINVPFMLTSVISPKRLEKMFSPGEPMPVLLQKPINIDECKVLIKSFLEKDEPRAS